ncbi:hypothetical protein KP509_04G046300 [Ceratopteris richardii]|nr:hypothetical protein KP509_04G046300 [Ceratopteris richardii]
MGGSRGEKQHFTSSRYGQETENTRKDNFQEGAGFSSTLEELSQKNFEKKVLNQLGTWAVLFVPTVSNDVEDRFQILDQVAKSLKGSIKVGYVDCGKQRHLCQEQNSWPLKTTKLRLYSLKNTGKLTGLDFTGEWTVTAVKKYCVEVLPNFSKHLDHVGLLDEVFDEEEIPMVVLLTKKKDTPAIWRALSGLFYGQIAFFDVQVDANDGDISARQYKVDEFPAIVGRYASGKAKVLSSGPKLEQDSSVEQIKVLLEDFEQKSKTAGTKKENMFDYGDVPSLTKNNLKKVCGSDISLCIIGVHKSSRGKDKLKQILKEISQKSLIRRGGSANLSKKPISYSLLDARKQAAFLSSFERSVSESENTVLIAYKPKRGTYTIYNGPLSLESAESFVVGVLGGDLSLKRVLQDPVLV